MPLIGFIAALPAIVSAFSAVRQATKKPPRPQFVPAVLGRRERRPVTQQFQPPLQRGSIPTDLMLKAFLSNLGRPGASASSLDPGILTAILRAP